jgi:hypothetical protein
MNWVFAKPNYSCYNDRQDHKANPDTYVGEFRHLSTVNWAFAIERKDEQVTK